jgi:hypothetical protein
MADFKVGNRIKAIEDDMSRLTGEYFYCAGQKGTIIKICNDGGLFVKFDNGYQGIDKTHPEACWYINPKKCRKLVKKKKYMCGDNYCLEVLYSGENVVKYNCFKNKDKPMTFDNKDKPMTFDPTKPVQTRDGRKARIICTDACCEDPIIALVDSNGHEYVFWYSLTGKHSRDDIESDNDLINIPEPKPKCDKCNREY